VRLNANQTQQTRFNGTTEQKKQQTHTSLLQIENTRRSFLKLNLSFDFQSDILQGWRYVVEIRAISSRTSLTH
jgi:hypothetical protein